MLRNHICLANCARAVRKISGLEKPRVEHFRSISSQKSGESMAFRVLVVGGGSGGCSMAAKCVNKLGKGSVGIIEPADNHYYQPMWTLVGGGMKTLQQSGRPMASVLPKGATWIKEKATNFDPARNHVTTSSGKEIKYDYLIVAMGNRVNYDKVTGLVEALEKYPEVCSIYSNKYVTKTFPAIQKLRKGKAIFTFPNTPIKCPGAPQKIMYIAEDYWRKNNVRKDIEVMYNTSLGVIFGVKKYADVLSKIVDRRDIDLNLKRSLVEVRPQSREAIFEHLDSTNKELITYKYDFLHVTPPMGPPVELKDSPLVDAAGYLDVDKDTLQHSRFPNVFGIGDCTNVPTSKTAAAVAAESGILKTNLFRVMNGEKAVAKYDGYTSCPLVTGYDKCVLAEFDFKGQPLETFPFDQGIERRTMFHMKKDLMPFLYWQLMLRGHWQGPAFMRKIMKLGRG